MTATLDRIERVHAQRAARAEGLPPTATYSDAIAVLADLPGALMRARAWRGITQPQAAGQLGVTQKTWWQWESGRQPPSRAYAAELLDWVRQTHLTPDRRGWCANRAHQLAEVGVYHSPNGRSHCRGCSRERERERKQRLRQTARRSA